MQTSVLKTGSGPHETDTTLNNRKSPEDITEPDEELRATFSTYGVACCNCNSNGNGNESESLSWVRVRGKVKRIRIFVKKFKLPSSADNAIAHFNTFKVSMLCIYHVRCDSPVQCSSSKSKAKAKGKGICANLAINFFRFVARHFTWIINPMQSKLKPRVIARWSSYLYLPVYLSLLLLVLAETLGLAFLWYVIIPAMTFTHHHHVLGSSTQPSTSTTPFISTRCWNDASAHPWLVWCID